jgi:hypothetical protein
VLGGADGPDVDVTLRPDVLGIDDELDPPQAVATRQAIATKPKRKGVPRTECMVSP